ncbi:DUF3995 domain-containing protein [Shimia sp. NS0008-38b]|uniref:DUF3995 domain-containing protein n=1 Tax=Shimia sp. NS0008-38b TaxID=3127653 RepID=UPI0031098919
MTWLAALLSALLAIPALLHLLWALGIWLPLRDETALARAVVGAKDVTRMPPAIPCAVVAMALTFAAVLPHRPAFPLHTPFMLLCTVVFTLRGAATYLPAWRRIVPQQPFATLDRSCYGPLCLLLGAGFFITTLTGA